MSGKKHKNLYYDAFGVVEIILILVIIIGLVLIFKDQIESIITDAINSFSGKAKQII